MLINRLQYFTLFFSLHPTTPAVSVFLHDGAPAHASAGVCMSLLLAKKGSHLHGALAGGCKRGAAKMMDCCRALCASCASCTSLPQRGNGQQPQIVIDATAITEKAPFF